MPVINFNQLIKEAKVIVCDGKCVRKENRWKFLTTVLQNGKDLGMEKDDALSKYRDLEKSCMEGTDKIDKKTRELILKFTRTDIDKAIIAVFGTEIKEVTIEKPAEPEVQKVAPPNLEKRELEIEYPPIVIDEAFEKENAGNTFEQNFDSEFAKQIGVDIGEV